MIILHNTEQNIFSKFHGQGDFAPDAISDPILRFTQRYFKMVRRKQLCSPFDALLQLKIRWKLLTRVHYVRPCNEPSIMDCPDLTFRSTKDGDLYYNTTCFVTQNVRDISEVH